MKIKEEVIKEAYENQGFNWEESKNLVDENGWTKHEVGFPKKLSSKGVSWRPDLPNGFDDNNGWISINSEKGLPSDLEVCHFVPCGSFNEQFTGFIKDDEVYFVDYNLQVFKDDEQDLLYLNSWLKCQITHYQPIFKPNPPLHK